MRDLLPFVRRKKSERQQPGDRVWKKKCVVGDVKRAYSIARKAKAQKTKCPGLDRAPEIIHAPAALCNKPGQT